MATKATQDRGQQDQGASAASTGEGMHVVAKPIGPVCNLNCEYCFYLVEYISLPGWAEGTS